MYAVGRLITQGVYTVSGPFHPFGGAVDMVVVQQQDGSLKSSPWYVRFGKFQGLLKAKERIVDINVNGVDADFHMYLDPRGEAYFLREIDSDETGESVLPNSPFFKGRNVKSHPVKSKSMNLEFDPGSPVADVSNGTVISRNNSKRSRILGFVLGRRSMNEHIMSKQENVSDVSRTGSLERAEIAADLLEMRWSTNLSPRKNTKLNTESKNDNGDITGGRLDGSLVLHEQHFVDKLENLVDNQETIVQNVNKSVDDENCVSGEILEKQFDDSDDPEVGLITARGSLEIVPESYAEIGTNQEDASLQDDSCSNSVTIPVSQTEMNEIRPPLKSNDVLIQKVSEKLIFGDIDGSKPSINKMEQEVNGTGVESTGPINGPDPLMVKTNLDGLKGDVGNMRRCPSYVEISKSRNCEPEIGRRAKSLPNMWSQFDNRVAGDIEEPQFYSPVGKLRSKHWDMLRDDASRIKNANLEKEIAKSRNNSSNDLKDASIASGGTPDGAGGSWSLWPFRRAGSKNVSEKENNNINNNISNDNNNNSNTNNNNNKKDSDVDIAMETEVDCSPKLDKMHTRALAPTAEQLASLNLSEGQNTVTFTFSTSVLGPQKVDARIYLWRWDTRIVISDVDGTITKSDVLGQFMPLVGRDWSHIGVTHLFSGIKENGYQMLYLSARAVSQASITRQFLFNLKQDGKALPDGPVVISPDGLFPSLFREVIRRAPHEFKIACLEDIKTCFPSDRNPFYAGFGNRDTDEFSYLKVGIPKGKIFIINPKGEVVINRCIDSKSYASLHALVHDIFPPISVHEELEDYNSWNFWKLPPPIME